MDNSAVICAFFVKQTTLHRDTEAKVGLSLCHIHQFRAETLLSFLTAAMLKLAGKLRCNEWNQLSKTSNVPEFRHFSCENLGANKDNW